MASEDYTLVYQCNFVTSRSQMNAATQLNMNKAAQCLISKRRHYEFWSPISVAFKRIRQPPRRFLRITISHRVRFLPCVWVCALHGHVLCLYVSDDAVGDHVFNMTLGMSQVIRTD